ncbi:hypothetical protein DUNSADRAFT_8271 [Dunaliella salina]|uniref:Peptidase C14 caspase domain-containing protein n=1 Tax=Dunaliella salina TaxID=3046 RepID=A0ABQ7HA75_DUNSA|nr:hypothetical protein DUNSADRAFT_8271 [Dunaliella salina]|eukprot:KAF5843755.1 hypothetical protein DUNSADRAFT_8271 [Dunaliella salina]
MGFDEGDIAIMVDTDKEYTQPTGKNIKDHLSKMVAEAKDGDLLFLHFSGHAGHCWTILRSSSPGLRRAEGQLPRGFWRPACQLDPRVWRGLHWKMERNV